MNVEITYVLITIAVGIGATLIMDLWAILLKRALKTAPPNYCLVGRWLLHIPAGVFRHSNITTAPQMPAECAVGWIAHYATGVVYAIALVLLVSHRWLQEPTLAPAMILGIATVAIPLLIMQPAFGLGIASSKTPNPAQARVRSLVNHVVFGFGLYVSALAISLAFDAHA
jgi:hypothetical protein